MSINTVTVSGNLTRDAQLRKAGESSVLSFSVAVNERKRNRQSGEWEDVPNYFDCSLFGARAEKLAQYLTKGTKVSVSGRLRYSSWEKDGQKRSKVDIVVGELEFLSRRQERKRDVYDGDIPFD